jgi:ribosomal protein S18 acetylase RimI-like enzyme
VIRPLLPKDRPGLTQILARTSAFTPAEVACALELVDIALTSPSQPDYLFLCAVDADDKPIGYACYGPIPLTSGTYDLYWIVVDPSRQQRGIGTALLRCVEQEIGKQGARMLLIQTSSQPKYSGTRAFYAKNGYAEVARIQDYYVPGDDGVTYQKRFESTEPGEAPAPSPGR